VLWALGGPVGDALRNRAFRRLWLAGFSANVARWLDLLVLGWLALALTGSPFMVGVAAFCRVLPMMVLGPFAGVIAERAHRGRLLAATQATGVVAAAALAALFAAGRGSFWPLVGVEVILGAAWAIDSTTRRTAIYTLIGPDRLASAVSLDTVSMQLAKMLGPLVGGVLLARAGPAGSYAVLALLHALALGSVLTLQRALPGPEPRARDSVIQSLVVGLREVWRQPPIRGVLLVTIAMNVLVFPYQQMLPVFARDVFRVGPELLGLLLAADGLGALIGALAVASWHGFLDYRLVFGGGALLASALLLAFALSPVYGLALCLLLLLGFAESGFATMQGTIVMLEARDAVRGRALGILSACIGTGPLGALWLGFFAGQLGAPAATAAGATTALLLMLPVAGRMVWRRADARG
jgi:predicted MFS family arabinose efflux permease